MKCVLDIPLSGVPTKPHFGASNIWPTDICYIISAHCPQVVRHNHSPLPAPLSPHVATHAAPPSPEILGHSRSPTGYIASGTIARAPRPKVDEGRGELRRRRRQFHRAERGGERVGNEATGTGKRTGKGRGKGTAERQWVVTRHAVTHDFRREAARCWHGSPHGVSGPRQRGGPSETVHCEQSHALKQLNLALGAGESRSEFQRVACETVAVVSHAAIGLLRKHGK